MLTTSWAALTEHTASEQYTGHRGGMQGKRSHLRERAGVHGQWENAVSTKAEPTASTKAEPTVGIKAEPTVGIKAEPTASTGHALVLGINHSTSSLSKHSSHHRNQNPEHTAESWLVGAQATPQMPS